MFVATKASKQKGKTSSSHVSATFHGRTKKRLIHDEAQPIPSQTTAQKTELPDMRKLRYEIIKFGTSGFSGTSKENANVAFMVSLGAEPPKNKAKNYKEILLEKKVASENEDSRFNMENNAHLLKKRKKTRIGAKKNKNVKGLLNVYGQVHTSCFSCVLAVYHFYVCL